MNWYGSTLHQKVIKILARLGNSRQVQYQAQLHKHSPIRCRLTFRLFDNASVLTQHSDVLRRRFQINTMSGMGYQYTGIFDAVRVIVSQEGLRGMYKGIVPNLLKVAPSMASSWLSFEMTRDFLVGLKAEPIVV